MRKNGHSISLLWCRCLGPPRWAFEHTAWRAATNPLEFRGMKLETLCLHGGTQPDPTTLSRAVPVYRTSSFVFKSAEHAAYLFALKELGNIHTRLQNPTTDVLEKRVSLLEGAPEMGGLALASGTSAVFYSMINLAAAGDNIVSARNLYGVYKQSWKRTLESGSLA